MFGRACTFDSLPTGVTITGAFSGDGVYFAVAHTTTPFITIYKRSGEAFTRLLAPDLLPAGAAYGCSFSEDGLYLAVAHANAPILTIYKRSGDTFTKLADPATLPSGTGEACSFTADGLYLAITHFNSPYLSIYKRSGDTFTKLANPATLPTSPLAGCSFAPDGGYLAITSHASYSSGWEAPAIYKRTGDAFVLLPDLPSAAGGRGRCVSFSPDGNMLAAENHITGRLNIYSRSADAFTIAAYMSAGAVSVDFSADGKYLAYTVYSTSAPALTVYERDGASIGEQVQVAFPLSWGGNFCKFSPDSALVVVGKNDLLVGLVVESDTVPDKPHALAPRNTYISINDDAVLSWEHSNASGTPQAAADLQYRRPDGEWAGLVSVAGAESNVTIPADTFEAGSYQWRVRTYNQDGYPGEWSDPAAFMAVGVPATPLIAGATNSSRPVVTWSAGSQQGYQLQIVQGDTVIWDSLETAGIAQTRKVPIYLGNGEYKARVRIVNASMLWSAWAEQEFTIDVTGPAKPALTAEAIAGAAVLTFAATGAEKLYLLRDVIPIANVTGLTTYTDHAALGSTVYVLRAVDASDNYTDSDPVAVTVSVPCVIMAAVDALDEPVQMHMKKSDQHGVSRQKDVMGSAHYYAGRTRPVYRFSGFVGEQYSPAFYYTTSTDFARLEALIDKRLTILYRDNLGNKYYGVITGITHTQENYMYEFALAIMRVDYVEQIDYEV